MSEQKCDVCNSGLVFRWTDTHGVGVCCTCGAPYTIYHYDPETKERLEKPPELALNATGKALAERYWLECKAMVFPASFDMGFIGGRERSYSGASQADERAFYEWVQKQPEAQPA
jgi:hypothetical protein